MIPRIKQGLAGLLLVTLGGAAGFYLGIGHGAKIMSTMAAQNVMASSFRGIERSLDALEKDDLALAEKKLQVDLRIALVDIAAQTRLHLSIPCQESNALALRRAKIYLEAHQDIEWLKLDDVLAPALRACDSPEK